MKDSFVTDTMALVLRLENRKLTSRVKLIFKDAEDGKITIHIPTMVLAELGYLSEKGKIETTLNEVKNYTTNHPSIIIEPITESIIERTFQINDIPELHDRIIAALAIEKEMVLITNDPVISQSKHVKVIW